MRIKLNDGSYAKVDKQDYETLRVHQWRVTSHGYARAWINKKDVYMHRIINNTPKGHETDHINGDRLDNRRSNLRTVTTSVNQLNRNRTVGVHYMKDRNKWSAYIMINRKQKHLGYWGSKDDAIKARKSYEATI